MTMREMYKFANNEGYSLEYRYAIVRRMVLRRRYINLVSKKENDRVASDLQVLQRTRWRRQHRRKAGKK